MCPWPLPPRLTLGKYSSNWRISGKNQANIENRPESNEPIGEKNPPAGLLQWRGKYIRLWHYHLGHKSFLNHHYRTAIADSDKSSSLFSMSQDRTLSKSRCTLLGDRQVEGPNPIKLFRCSQLASTWLLSNYANVQAIRRLTLHEAPCMEFLHFSEEHALGMLMSAQHPLHVPL